MHEHCQLPVGFRRLEMRSCACVCDHLTLFHKSELMQLPAPESKIGILSWQRSCREPRCGGTSVPLGIPLDTVLMGIKRDDVRAVFKAVNTVCIVPGKVLISSSGSSHRSSALSPTRDS